MSDVDTLMTKAREYCKATGRDLFIFSGGIDQSNSERFAEAVLSVRNRKKKAALFLTTFGGDPHCAYRMARVLRRCYPEDVRILVGGYCKSAGTLCALIADSFGFSEFGELGPLDTQITRPDEVAQMASGLEVFSTLQYLTDHAFSCFEQSMLSIITRSGQTISTKLASEIASKLTAGLMSPITAQLDPSRIGIAQRGLEVTNVYGRQLANQKNLLQDPDDVVEHLVKDYPTHSFVIDQDEAKQLFKNVSSFDQGEAAIYEQLRSRLIRPSKELFLVNFNPLLEAIEAQENSNARTPAAATRGTPQGPAGEPKRGATGGKANGKTTPRSNGGKTPDDAPPLPS